MWRIGGVVFREEGEAKRRIEVSIDFEQKSSIVRRACCDFKYYKDESVDRVRMRRAP